MPKVSIVVPVYNVEQYLDECLKSILLQDFADFECILVNDGSTDNSKEICENYVKMDSRFVVLNQINSGVTKARLNGVIAAKGEWIMFLDSDDALTSDALSLLFKVSDDCDIVIGHTKLCPAAYVWPFIAENAKYSRFAYLKQLMTNKIHGGPCARIIKKELFNNFVYEIPTTVVLGEDYIMNIRLCQDLKAVRTIDREIYNYRYVEHFYKRDVSSLFQRMVVEIKSVKILNLSFSYRLYLTGLTIFTFLLRNLKSFKKRFF
ncbi:glycosyltransferase family 2 protein [Saccharicrinis sp. 156]|uniref:glycosyltransferase family 2 protein n=1 Tax=Saccharicrinis sp. 156 TaxID=3417574 RepID=UPI003D3430E0